MSKTAKEILSILSDKGIAYTFQYHTFDFIKYNPHTVARLHPSFMCIARREWMVQEYPLMVIIHAPDYMICSHPDVVKKWARPLWERYKKEGKLCEG